MRVHAMCAGLYVCVSLRVLCRHRRPLRRSPYLNLMRRPRLRRLPRLRRQLPPLNQLPLPPFPLELKEGAEAPRAVGHLRAELRQVALGLEQPVVLLVEPIALGF